MQKIRVEDALGMAICHDITAMYDGFKGPLFRRGHVIAEEDIPRLLDIGKRYVYVWQENAGEIHEEDAALRMAAAAPTEHGAWSGPSEGKMTLKSSVDGMFRADRDLLEQLNSIGDLTYSAIPDHFPVRAGDRLASMRIVPLVTQETQIEEAERLCAGRQLFDVLPYETRRVGILITGSELYSGRIQDKFEAVARRKLSAYPAEIIGVTVCDDDPDMLRTAALRLIDAGADALFFSGGMSVDPDDITPSVIRSLADQVVTYGVPAQPGNMTMIAYRGNTAMYGIPGASISMPVTMFDVILPQAFTDLRFTRQDVVRLGCGGLCRQCKPCHFPDCTFGRY